MITKLCLVCLCIVSCSMVGLKLNKDSLNRVKYFESLVAFINTLTAEIKFRQVSLKNVLNEFSAGNTTSLNIHIKELLAYLDGNTGELKLSKNRLTAAEMECVKNFFLSLGVSDSETQLFELSNYKIKIEATSAEVAAKHKKYGGLYLKLSFLCGIAIGILLI